MIEDNELERLEGFVSTMLEKFNALQVVNKGLKDQLEEKAVKIEILQKDLSSMESERGQISSRVSDLIGKIEEWEANDTILLEHTPENSTVESDNSTGLPESNVQKNLFTATVQAE